MDKKQKISILLLVLLGIVSIGICALVIYITVDDSKAMQNGECYTKVIFKEAEFLGKFTYQSRSNPGNSQIYDEFKLLDNGKIIRIYCGINSGHSGEKQATIAFIKYYRNDTRKLIFEETVLVEDKDSFIKERGLKEINND